MSSAEAVGVAILVFLEVFDIGASLGLAKGISDLRLLAWWQWRPSSTGTCLRTSSSLALSIGGSGAAGFFVTCCALVAAEKEPYKMHQLGGTGNLPLQEVP